MTDKEALKEMLHRAAIEFEETEEGWLEVHRGYFGFVTTFEFDKQGRLKDMGAFE